MQSAAVRPAGRGSAAACKMLCGTDTHAMPAVLAHLHERIVGVGVGLQAQGAERVKRGKGLLQVAPLAAGGHHQVCLRRADGAALHAGWCETRRSGLPQVPFALCAQPHSSC